MQNRSDIEQNLSDTGVIGYRSTRRYYRTYSDAGVPVGTTELIQTDTGIPVGTTRLIQIQDLSDAGVPVGTTGLIQRQKRT